MEHDVTFIPVTQALVQPQKAPSHAERLLPYRSNRAIRNRDVIAFLEELDAHSMLRSVSENTDARVEFLRRYPEWLQSSRQTRLDNLDAFRYVACTHGTLHAFDAFHAVHRDRRFRCF